MTRTSAHNGIMPGRRLEIGEAGKSRASPPPLLEISERRPHPPRLPADTLERDAERYGRR